jgi:Spy/CpxP family protein refolding chaperone
MLHRLLAGLVLGLIATTALADKDSAVDSSKKTAEANKNSEKKSPEKKPHKWRSHFMHRQGMWTLGDRPLRNLIQGQIGRWLVLKSEMDLTPLQKLRIFKIMHDRKADILRVARGIWDKRQALMNQVLAENSDEGAIRKAADDLGKAIGDAAVVMSKVAGDVRPVLTSEQRQLIGKFRGDTNAAVEKFFNRVSRMPEKKPMKGPEKAREKKHEEKKHEKKDEKKDSSRQSASAETVMQS